MQQPASGCPCHRMEQPTDEPIPLPPADRTCVQTRKPVFVDFASWKFGRSIFRIAEVERHLHPPRLQPKAAALDRADLDLGSRNDRSRLAGFGPGSGRLQLGRRRPSAASRKSKGSTCTYTGRPRRADRRSQGNDERASGILLPGPLRGPVARADFSRSAAPPQPPKFFRHSGAEPSLFNRSPAGASGSMNPTGRHPASGPGHRTGRPTR